MEHGEAIWFADYGLPARTVAPAFVHGRVFIAAMPLVGPPSDRLPPPWAIKVAVRVVPAFRRRAAAAARALAERTWLDDTRRWYEVDRLAWVERNRAVDAVDPASLSDRSWSPTSAPRTPTRKPATSITSGCTAPTSCRPACSSDGRRSGASIRSTRRRCWPVPRRRLAAMGCCRRGAWSRATTSTSVVPPSSPSVPRTAHRHRVRPCGWTGG